LNYQSLGSVSLVDNDEPEMVIVDLPCDLRAHHFLIKLEADNAFELLGVVFDFYFDGDR